MRCKQCALHTKDLSALPFCCFSSKKSLVTLRLISFCFCFWLTAKLTSYPFRDQPAMSRLRLGCIFVLVLCSQLEPLQCQDAFSSSRDSVPVSRFLRRIPVPVTNNDFNLYPPSEKERISCRATTTKGSIRGEIVQLAPDGGQPGDTEREISWQDGLNVTVFIGIPYAEPPIGDLRFRVRIMACFHFCCRESHGIVG